MSWQKILAQGFSSRAQLLNFLELPSNDENTKAQQDFPSRIPLDFAKRMQKKNPKDPLLLQVLAVDAELEKIAGYEFDPLNERRTNPLKGLLHKYHGRVLLTLTGACAIHCRYCFRRHFDYQENNPGRKGLAAICAYIAKDNSITEVILSGGDPLLASNLVLKHFIEQLELIPHVRTLRIHTRLPVVLPQRIELGLLEILEATSLKKVIVLHCNHPQELALEVKIACDALIRTGCYLLNQSVLLAEINDDAKILANLSHDLFRFGIMPYYLHILDKIAGTAHFDLPISKIRDLYRQLQNLLPGYLLPRLVREDPGKQSKTLII